MLTFLLSLAFFALSASAANCPPHRVGLCTNADPIGWQLCENFYQFYFDSDMVPLHYPVFCKTNFDGGSNCTDSPESPVTSMSGLCNPDCAAFGKSITLNLCSAISTRSSCIISAGSDNKWCYWDASAGVCMAAGITCS